MKNSNLVAISLVLASILVLAESAKASVDCNHQNNACRALAENAAAVCNSSSNPSHGDPYHARLCELLLEQDFDQCRKELQRCLNN